MIRRSPGLGRDLAGFDLVLPDGIGLCLALRWFRGLSARRVSFDMTSLAPAIFDLARTKGLRVVLVGGAPGVANRAARHIVTRHPGLAIAGVFDGYGDEAGMVARIDSLKPQIVICGMGSPKQEAFLLRLRQHGWRGWGFTCGGFFDQTVEGVHYYPQWIDEYNLRWMYRLIREPRRLWRRYLMDYPLFAVSICREITKGPSHAPSRP